MPVKPENEAKKRGRAAKPKGAPESGPPSGRDGPSDALVSFEATLWLMADKLRSNMDAAEYKHAVLGLIHGARRSPPLRRNLRRSRRARRGGHCMTRPRIRKAPAQAHEATISILETVQVEGGSSGPNGITRRNGAGPRGNDSMLSNRQEPPSRPSTPTVKPSLIVRQEAAR